LTESRIIRSWNACDADTSSRRSRCNNPGAGQDKSISARNLFGFGSFYQNLPEPALAS
jgi:hypothetical protein